MRSTIAAPKGHRLVGRVCVTDGFAHVGSIGKLNVYCAVRGPGGRGTRMLLANLDPRRPGTISHHEHQSAVR